jgi:hypothetical protein
MDLNRSEAFNLDKVFCCVLAKGKNEEGKEMYVYFGIHLHNLQRLYEDVKKNGAFNPKDYNAGVLAWAKGGYPTDPIIDFMRDKFSFHDDQVVLELSRS